jgi:hypothetical protein
MRSLHKKDLFPDRFFKAANQPEGWRQTFEIETVRIEELQNGDKKTEKTVVYFKRVKTGLVIGPTVFDQIAAVTGEDDAANWADHRITLFRDKTPFGKDIVPCIRVDRPDAPPKKPAKKAAPKLSLDYDDSVEV